MSLDKSTIYALVVGVSKYGFKKSDLEGPVPDALRFAAWLRKNQIDPANIRLFLSPADEGKEECDERARELNLGYVPATKGDLDRYFDKQFPSGSLFLFYWSGHGVVDKRNHRYLFFEDTTENALNYHLDVTNTLDFLRAKAMPRQMGFIDTCAKTVEWDLGLNERPFPPGSARQSYLYAASPGQAAADSKTRRTSKFSEALLEVLEQGSFPPDPSTVAKQMLRRFARDAEQRPQYFAYKDFNSDESVDGTRPASEYVQSVASAKNIPAQGLRRLADIAAQGDQLSQSAVRDKLYSDLRALAAGVDLARPDFFRSDASDDLLQIFAGALDRGLIKDLCNLLDRADAESLPVRRMLEILPQLQEAAELTRLLSVEDALPAFVETKPLAESLTGWDSVSSMIWNLAESVRVLSPVAEFLLRIANRRPERRKELTDWAARFVAQATLDRIAGEVVKQPSFLFIDIERTGGANDSQDTVEAFLQRGRLTLHSWPAQKSRSEQLNKVIDKITYEAETLTKGFFVQILVSREMFDLNPHTIPVEGDPLGTYFPVALRWRERIYQLPRTRYQEWIERAAEIRKHLTLGCGDGCRWFDIKQKLFRDARPGLIAFSGPDFEMIKEQIKSGAPFAVWPLADSADEAGLRSAVDQLAGGARSFDEVPRRLKMEREAKRGPEVSLFWDDPQQLKAWKLSEP